MSNVVISVENLSKVYRLGQIGTGTLSHDINVWWAKVRGKPNPLLRIGETDHGNRDGETIWALKDVTFTVEQGEVLGIIGRNGAGKSTLLKILSRVTAPTSGHARVKGRIASLLEVGTGFHPELTGRENIYLNGAILGMSRIEIERKFHEIVDFAEVEKFIDTPVKRYSSGMYVRLAFAVAAHLEPEILVVDEVLAVGDAEFQKKCLGKMGDVAKEGRTVLFVSHNMQSIVMLCSHGLILKDGRLICEGSAVSMSEKYLREMLVNKDFSSLSDFDHQKSTDDAMIVRIEIINPETDTIITQLKSGQGFIVKIHFISAHPKKLIKFGFALLTALGTRVFNTVSTDHGLEIQQIHGVGSIELLVDGITLAPGLYFANIAITDRVGQYYDYKKGIPCFDVIPSEILPKNRGYDIQSGIIYPAILWRAPTNA